MVKYIIVPVSELPKLNFDEVQQTSIETCRVSIDASLALISFDAEPAALASLEGRSAMYSYEEILEIMSTDIWSSLDMLI